MRCSVEVELADLVCLVDGPLRVRPRSPGAPPSLRAAFGGEVIAVRTGGTIAKIDARTAVASGDGFTPTVTAI